MSHMPPFRLNVPNLNDITAPPSNPKKRRKNTQPPIQPSTPVQDLLPPPLTGYGDTIVASNPFDDCPSNVNPVNSMPPRNTQMNMNPMMNPNINMYRSMCPINTNPMMHSPNQMNNPMMMNGPPQPRMNHMNAPPPHMMNGPNGPPMNMTGPPMHSPMGGGMQGGNAGPMGSPMGPMNGGGGMGNPMNGPPMGHGGPNPGHGGPGGMQMNAPNGPPIGPPMNNNNFIMSPSMNPMYPKPMPVTAGKVYPADQPMVFNSQNPNAPPIYPCGVCHKEVHDNDQAILCESGCNFWFHRGCTGLTEAAFQLLTQEVYAEWVCDKCLNSKNIPLVKFKP